MARGLVVKPTHKAIKNYYAALTAYADQSVEHEGAVRSAFQNLLADTGRKVGWTLIPELSLDANGHSIRPDGTFRDEFTIERGYWEAKDSDDDLPAEIKKKIKRGYRLTNTIFEDTREAHLYQDGKVQIIADLSDPQRLCDLLNEFFSHTEPAHEDFNKAVDEFKQRVPDLARGLVELISKAHKDNQRFIEAFGRFFELCKSSLNPNLDPAAVDEMLVQHLLTERLIRTVFDSQDFTRRNVIAAEIENVIDALVSKSFNRHEYLEKLDRFYVAIEAAARTLSGFAEKQHFLNVVYERFFQGYSVKVADTHGIVYTPQEIVDFMCASVAELLEKEFGKKLGDPEVNILDPCTGTGNFIVNLIGRIPKRDLPRVYREQLFANEVMLLPYYIAALNIEHAYYEKTGQYEAFDGLCFVDTLDLTEGSQKTFGFMAEENVQRVERQRKAPITVILGNPPYNMGQVNENDNNKNRSYEHIDGRIRQSYVIASAATLQTKLYDAYIKFFRWATDRLGARSGIVCFVSNNGFVDGLAFDGFRKHLVQDFHSIYHFDFKGNARTSGERRRREGGNIFSDQIRVGVGITVLVRRSSPEDRHVYYHCVEDFWRAEIKAQYLSSFASLTNVPWQTLTPDKNHNWFPATHAKEYERYTPIATKAIKAKAGLAKSALFAVFSPGVNTARDSVVYSIGKGQLQDQIERFCDAYNSEVDRYRRKMPVPDVDAFVDYRKIKWSSTLKSHLQRLTRVEYDDEKIRGALYRPFNKRVLFYDDVLIDRPALFRTLLPTHDSESENHIICTPGLGSKRPPFCIVTNCIGDFHLTGDTTQCFPFYIYEDGGSNRRENITDWALKHFRDNYGDRRTTKWDIFHYVYSVLHHPGYREKYADSLKRELPRIPLAPDFRAFVKAGKQLAKLHIEYESLDPWPLEWIETPNEPLSYRVEKMKLAKDKKSVTVNDSLTLAGIPPEVFEYRLGNRSAVEWVIDQYRVKEDKRSGIRSDPNNPDDEEYIVRLLGQVVRVSVETVKIVKSLPERYAPDSEKE